MPLEEHKIFEILNTHDGDPLKAEIQLANELIATTIEDAGLSNAKTKQTLLGTYWRSRHFSGYLTQMRAYLDKTPAYPLEELDARVFSRLIVRHEKHCGGLPQNFQKPVNTPTYAQSFALLKELNSHAHAQIEDALGKEPTQRFDEELDKNADRLSNAILNYFGQQKKGYRD